SCRRQADHDGVVARQGQIDDDNLEKRRNSVWREKIHHVAASLFLRDVPQSLRCAVLEGRPRLCINRSGLRRRPSATGPRAGHTPGAATMLYGVIARRSNSSTMGFAPLIIPAPIQISVNTATMSQADTPGARRSIRQ